MTDHQDRHVCIIERTDEPMTWLESAEAAAYGAAKGAVISGALSAAVGGTIGALAGMENSANYLQQLDETGGIKLGGYTLPGLFQGPSVLITEGAAGNPGLISSSVSGAFDVREALTSNPAVTGAALGGVNAALNTGTSAALIGAAVGAVKESWVDRIVKERVISQQEITRG